MSVEERLAILETETRDGFERVADQIGHVGNELGALTAEVRTGFREVNGRVKKQELESAGRAAALKTLMIMGAVPGVALAVLSIVLAVREL